MIRDDRTETLDGRALWATAGGSCKMTIPGQVTVEIYSVSLFSSSPMLSTTSDACC